MILTREQALEIFKRRVSVRYYDPARKSVTEDFAAILDSAAFRPAPSAASVAVCGRAERGIARKNQTLRLGMQASISDASHVFSCWHENTPATTAPLLKN